MREIIIYILIFYSALSSAQINKYISKGAKAAENNKLDLAKEYYLKAYQLDSTDYRVNLGLGNVLTELLGKHEEAIPYLEKAYSKSPTDTLPDLVFALGKCYQHVGAYNKALTMFKKLDGTVALEDDDHFYQLDLKKRKLDCQYALDHTEVASIKDLYIVNVGPNVNTDMPEYVPVITPKNELIFTSRRKDSPKEKRNEEDGKYFESMYVSKIENGRPQPARRYTLPDLYLKSKFRKQHESIISMSSDNKTLFIFRDNKIFEIDIDSVSKEQPKKLSKVINFDYYQNHAFLSKDDKMLLFTSEAEGGFGGNDIYSTIKNNDGVWEKPQNMGKIINTEYDEDAPFLSDDGQTLFFSSKGHPGYGNYDIYKSKLVNGVWTEPENLSLPSNSPANDIFMIQSNNAGYFSSSRKGGHGDMDIYRINYLKNYNKECTNGANSLLTISTTIINDSAGLVSFSASTPNYFKPIEYQWRINDSTFNDATAQISRRFLNRDMENTISAKIVNYCDTCFEPLITCNSIQFKFKKPEVLVANTNSNSISSSTLEPNMTEPTISEENSKYTYITQEKIHELGFELTPVRFDFNQSSIRTDALAILDKNIEILSKHPEVSVLIYGYTDSRGNKTYNSLLSKQRAVQIKQYLISKGIDPKQIKRTIGKGEKHLVNKCDDGVECDKMMHEQNRRVEFVLINTKK